LAETELGDTRVPTIALGDQRSNLGKELVHDRLVADDAQRTPASVHVATLREGDEALGNRAQTLRLRLGRLDRLVGEECGREVGEQQALVSRAAPETGTLGGLWHFLVLQY